MKTFIVKKNEVSDTLKTVYDIEVEDSHHYFLENGVISHNSGTDAYTGKAPGGGTATPGLHPRRNQRRHLGVEHRHGRPDVERTLRGDRRLHPGRAEARGHQHLVRPGAPGGPGALEQGA